MDAIDKIIIIIAIVTLYVIVSGQSIVTNNNTIRINELTTMEMSK